MYFRKVLLSMVYYQDNYAMTETQNQPSADLIQKEVDLIKTKFNNTSEIYTEVCVLLFFRYGITPTANMLYRLVKKGSMSAPVEALNSFWVTLRTKSKTRIERNDLPEELQAVGGDLLVSLWSKAQEHALSEVAIFKEEASRKIDEAVAAQLASAAEVTQVLYELAGLKDSYAESQSTVDVLHKQLDQAGQTIADLSKQLAQSRQETAHETAALKDRERSYRDDLEKLRQDAKLDSDRLREAEKRALLEIDRERQTSIRLQKELDTVRATLVKESDQYRNDMKVVQKELGDARQLIGKLEGVSQTLNRERDSLQNMLTQQAEALTTQGERVSTLEARLLHEKEKCDAAQASAQQWETEYRTMAQTCKDLQGRLSEAAKKK